MGTYKANTRIKYENEEVGIWLDELNKNRMLGKTLGKLLENAYYSDNKDILLGDAGVLANKVNKSYKDDLQGTINTLQDRLKEIHSMCVDLKTMALVGKRLELESRSENIEISTYVLNRQIKKLCTILGIETSDFKSEKMNTIDVCDIVDKVIDSYGAVLNNLKVDTMGISTLLSNLNTDTTMENVLELDAKQESSEATIVNSTNTEEPKQELADVGLGDIGFIGNF